MSDPLGLNVSPKDLGYLQVCLRGVIVFIVTLVMVRLADRRFLAKMSPFDVILSFIMASMLARAVNGSAPLFPTLVAGFVLVFLHRLLAWLAFHLDWVGALVKGQAQVLVENGRPKAEAMRSQKISEKDLFEELRLNGSTNQVENVQLATMERNGSVSVVKAKP